MKYLVSFNYGDSVIVTGLSKTEVREYLTVKLSPKQKIENISYVGDVL